LVNSVVISIIHSVHPGSSPELDQPLELDDPITMGCAQSIMVKAAEMGGVQLQVPGEQGTFAPHSDASFVCLDVMVSEKNGSRGGSLDNEFADNMKRYGGINVTFKKAVRARPGRLSALSIP
jgi:hypothetical protein